MALIALLIVGFFALGLDQHFSLDGARAAVAEFESLKTQNPLLLGLAFFAVYCVMSTLSIPGAVWITLASGALFGLVWGTVIVSFASSLGATGAMLVARYILRDHVISRYGQKMEPFLSGMQKDGLSYLLSLRLLPIVPYFLINLAMGLTTMRWPVFYIASQIGMLPGTIIFVNAGAQLGQIRSLDDVTSPGLIFSLCLLALLPIVGRVGATKYAQARRLRGFKRPKIFDRDLLVIGAGAAGLSAAYAGSLSHAKTTLIEVDEMGGDCLNRGCVPSKALIAAARKSPKTDFSAAMAGVEQAITAIAPHDSVERYTSLGVEVLRGRARFIDPWQVEITTPAEKKTLSARRFVIATGAKPFIPPISGLEDVGYVTTDSLWDCLASWKNGPPSPFIVLGGGPIGCELAQAMSQLGADVTVVEAQPHLLGVEDLAVSQALEAGLARAGVTVLTNATAQSCRPDKSAGDKSRGGHLQVAIKAEDGSTSSKDIPFALLLVAVGRRPDFSSLGIEGFDLLQEGKLPVDRHQRTRLDHIYAAGDAVSRLQFTPVAGNQGWIAAANALFAPFVRLRPEQKLIPRVTFSDPEIARVGLNQKEADADNISYESTRFPFDEIDRSLVARTQKPHAADGWIEVLTVPGRDKIIGVTIVGDGAGEMIALFTLAMSRGMGLKHLMSIIYAYPTVTEAARYAAAAWRKAHSPGWIEGPLMRYHEWRRGGK